MPDRLVIPASHVETFRDHLLQDDQQERFAYGYCTRSGDRLLVADIVPVPDEQMRTQSRTACRPKLDYERTQLEHCFSRGYHPFFGHSHAFSDTAGFSGIDLEAMAAYTDWLHPLYSDADLAFGVLGRQELEAVVYDPTTERLQQLPIQVVGNWRLDTPLPTDADTDEIDADLHDRSLRLLTEAGQARIAATTVGVVGTGGLGFLLAKELARLGVRKLVLIDPDHIEQSNLNRLLGVSTWDVGRPKVTVLAQHLDQTGLDIEVEGIPERVEDATDALSQCDVVFGTVDQVSTRSFLNQYCVQHLRFYIDAGTIIRTEDDHVTAIEGIVQLVAPGANACYACLDRADPERARQERLSAEELEAEVEEGYIDGSALAPEPAVVTLNGVIASQAASVFARLIAGYAEPPDMVRYEELASDLRELHTQRDLTCPTCGKHGLLGQGDREPTPNEFDRDETGLDLHLPATASEGGTTPDGVTDDHQRYGLRLRRHLWRLVQQASTVTSLRGQTRRG